MDVIAPVTDYVQGSILTTQGDLVIRGASEAERLAIGSAGQMLRVNSGASSYDLENAGAFLKEDEYSAERSGNLTITTAYQEVCSINLGTVLTGQRFLVCAFAHSGKDATAGLIEYELRETSGGATIAFCHDRTSLGACAYLAGNQYQKATIVGVLKITAGGTCNLRLSVKASVGGGTSYSGHSQLFATRISQ